MTENSTSNETITTDDMSDHTFSPKSLSIEFIRQFARSCKTMNILSHDVCIVLN